jgi:hypothetical protein
VASLRQSAERCRERKECQEALSECGEEVEDAEEGDGVPDECNPDRCSGQLCAQEEGQLAQLSTAVLELEKQLNRTSSTTWI